MTARRLACTCVLVAAVACTARAQPRLILHNANVITFDEALPAAQAVAIEGNRISAVGSDPEILALAGSSTEIIDLEGRTVTPGLIDAHSHMLKGGWNAEHRDGLRRAAMRMAEQGYTTAHELGVDNVREPTFIHDTEELASTGGLAVRMNLYLLFNDASGQVTDGSWNSHPYTTRTDTTFRIVGVKAFGDGGAVNVSCHRSLLVGGPAADGYGDCYLNQAAWDSVFAEILGAGYPIALHALGDSAVAVGLRAFESAFAGEGNTLRSRMEHVRVVGDDLADRMAELGIGASIQYAWAYGGVAFFDQWFAPDVLPLMFPWRALADRGIPIHGGIDGPNFSISTHPMVALSVLATRQRERDQFVPDWMAGNELTVEEGLRAFTVSNAWSHFEEDEKGTITAGKLADLTVLSDDPLAVDPFNVRFIDVDMTVMDGIIRHNQIGRTRLAVHDVGNFSIGVGDQGLWGGERLDHGLVFAGQDLLFSGSLLVSYDPSTVATAFLPQQDFVTPGDQYMQFERDGPGGSNRATAVFEDNVERHPGRLRVEQRTVMEPGASNLTIEYDFTNVGSEPITDAFVGQLAKFSIGNFRHNLAAWDSNDGLGFGYMYEADNPLTPYVGIAMFDSTGNSVNTSLTLDTRARIPWFDEERIASAMRSDTLETGVGAPGIYLVLPAAGPFDIEPGETISPFVVAFLAGESVGALRVAVNDAFAGYRSRILSQSGTEVPGRFGLTAAYPNPFAGRLTVEYRLDSADNVRLELYDVLGHRVATILDGHKPPGLHVAKASARNLASGVYVVRLRTEDGLDSSWKAVRLAGQ